MSTYVDRTASAVEYCEAAAAQHPEHAETYNTLKTYLQQKLWHQLTETLLQFFSNNNPVDALALYDKVVTAVDNKLHPLSTARMAVLVAEQLVENDATAAKAVLENCLEKTNDGTAKIYLQSKHSLLILQALLEQSPPGFTLETAPDETKAVLQTILQTLETNGPIVQELSSSASSSSSTTAAAAAANSDSAITHAAHYETAMSYYKLLGPAQAFYEAALNYLSGSTIVQDTPKFRQLAVDLCLAALTGENVYNLTVVEQHAILKLLEQSPEYGWLVELFKAVATGNITEFRRLTTTYAAQIQTQPALVHGATVLQEKLTLTALVLFVLAKDSHQRCIDFAELQQALQIEYNQVEYVLMRAFSVGLLQGSIDQVDSVVDITYVQPRVLSPSQMQQLAVKFADWASRVQTNAEEMQAQTANTLLA